MGAEFALCTVATAEIRTGNLAIARPRYSVPHGHQCKRAAQSEKLGVNYEKTSG